MSTVRLEGHFCAAVGIEDFELVLAGFGFGLFMGDETSDPGGVLTIKHSLPFGAFLQFFAVLLFLMSGHQVPFGGLSHGWRGLSFKLRGGSV